MKTILILLGTTLLFAVIPTTRAGTPLGGLTVAVSGDGHHVVAGGDTRTLLVLDSNKLDVLARHWIGTTIRSLVFNQSGSVLAVHDSADSVHLFATENWSKIAEVSKVANFSAAPEAGLFAGQNGSYSDPLVGLYQFDDGVPKGSVALPKDFKVAMLALKEDGSKVAVLSQSAKDEAEPKVERGDIPKELMGIERKEFEQRNDGDTSGYLVIDVASEAIESETVTFYKERNGEMVYAGDEVIIVGYSNVNTKVSPEGEFTLFQVEGSFNYGIGFSHDGSLILTGGLANYTFTSTESLTSVTGEIGKLPGWPEYWKGFSGTEDGSLLYGATSGFRVVKFKADGTIDAICEGH